MCEIYERDPHGRLRERREEHGRRGVATMKPGSSSRAGGGAEEGEGEGRRQLSATREGAAPHARTLGRFAPFRLSPMPCLLVLSALLHLATASDVIRIGTYLLVFIGRCLLTPSRTSGQQYPAACGYERAGTPIVLLGRVGYSENIFSFWTLSVGTQHGRLSVYLPFHY